MGNRDKKLQQVSNAASMTIAFVDVAATSVAKAFQQLLPYDKHLHQIMVELCFAVGIAGSKQPHLPYVG